MAIDYDSSREALFHPEQRATVFGANPPADAVALAVEAARLAYHRAETSGEALARLNADLVRAGFGAAQPFNDPRTDSQGFGALHETDGLGLLAFRGTEAERLRDLLTDVSFAKRPWPLVGGKVHDGFGDAAAALWPQVQTWLAKTAAQRTRLLVCGHSLGAAIATLLAVPAGATALVTIGSPRVGDVDFAKAFAAAAITTTRIVDFHDIVARVPPSFFPFGYRHVGRGTFVGEQGRLAPDAPPSATDADVDLMRAAAAGLQFATGGDLSRELSDHAPVNYLRAFWT